MWLIAVPGCCSARSACSPRCGSTTSASTAAAIGAAWLGARARVRREPARRARLGPPRPAVPVLDRARRRHRADAAVPLAEAGVAADRARDPRRAADRHAVGAVDGAAVRRRGGARDRPGLRVRAQQPRLVDRKKKKKVRRSGPASARDRAARPRPPRPASARRSRYVAPRTSPRPARARRPATWRGRRRQNRRSGRGRRAGRASCRPDHRTRARRGRGARPAPAAATWSAASARSSPTRRSSSGARVAIAGRSSAACTPSSSSPPPVAGMLLPPVLDRLMVAPTYRCAKLVREVRPILSPATDANGSTACSSCARRDAACSSRRPWSRAPRAPERARRPAADDRHPVHGRERRVAEPEPAEHQAEERQQDARRHSARATC